MHQARGGMGSRKHGKSGKDKRHKSPRFLHGLRRELDQTSDRVQRRSMTEWFSSFADLFHRRHQQ